jgi:hypothetical protein
MCIIELAPGIRLPHACPWLQSDKQGDRPCHLVLCRGSVDCLRPVSSGRLLAVLSSIGCKGGHFRIGITANPKRFINDDSEGVNHVVLELVCQWRYSLFFLEAQSRK